MKDAGKYREAVDDCFSLDPDGVMAEEFVDGREATVAVIDGETLPPIEISAAGGWYDYDAKYISDATRYDFLPDGELARALSSTALDAYRWNYGVTTRLTNDWFGVYARYRLNGLGQKLPESQVLLPRLEVGIQLCF